jgi:hypothetical protein
MLKLKTRVAFRFCYWVAAGLCFSHFATARILQATSHLLVKAVATGLRIRTSCATRCASVTQRSPQAAHDATPGVWTKRLHSGNFFSRCHIPPRRRLLQEYHRRPQHSLRCAVCSANEVLYLAPLHSALLEQFALESLVAVCSERRTAASQGTHTHTHTPRCCAREASGTFIGLCRC